MLQKTLAWGAWFWYQTVLAGTKTLEVCDYFGEALANFFGITTPKYQFEIDHYEKMVAEVLFSFKSFVLSFLCRLLHV